MLLMLIQGRRGAAVEKHGRPENSVGYGILSGRTALTRVYVRPREQEGHITVVNQIIRKTKKHKGRAARDEGRREKKVVRRSWLKMLGI